MLLSEEGEGAIALKATPEKACIEKRSKCEGRPLQKLPSELLVSQQAIGDFAGFIKKLQ